MFMTQGLEYSFLPKDCRPPKKMRYSAQCCWGGVPGLQGLLQLRDSTFITQLNCQPYFFFGHLERPSKELFINNIPFIVLHVFKDTMHCCVHLTFQGLFM